MSDYHTYTASELAQEDSFIHWVRGSDVSAVQFWDRWLEEHPEQAEKVASARQLVEHLHFKEAAPSQERIDHLWSRIEKAGYYGCDHRVVKIST